MSGGKNNGFETKPANALKSDGVFAVDTNSGTSTGTNCYDTGKDRHKFYNFNASLPPIASVQGIQVRLDAKADSTAGSPKMCISLSWDNGSTWTEWFPTSTLTTGEATYVLGGPTDIWGHSWLNKEITNANFQLRVEDNSSDNTRDFSLDWVAVKIFYSTAQQPIHRVPATPLPRPVAPIHPAAIPTQTPTALLAPASVPQASDTPTPAPAPKASVTPAPSLTDTPPAPIPTQTPTDVFTPTSPPTASDTPIPSFTDTPPP
jgi:hypothetical protein